MPDSDVNNIHISNEGLAVLVSTLQSGVDALNKTSQINELAINTLTETMSTLNEAMFGYWDRKSLTQQAGIIANQAAIMREWKIAKMVGGAVVSIVLAHALGVPTQLIAPALLHSISPSLTIPVIP